MARRISAASCTGVAAVLIAVDAAASWIKRE
jgi:hypothetical protein